MSRKSPILRQDKLLAMAGFAQPPTIQLPRPSSASLQAGLTRGSRRKSSSHVLVEAYSLSDHMLIRYIAISLRYEMWLMHYYDPK